MSKENVKLFLVKIQGDVRLQEKLIILNLESEKTVQENNVKLGAESGYPFSEKAYRQFMEETNTREVNETELNETELESVVGGGVFSDLVYGSYIACVSSFWGDRPNNLGIAKCSF